MTKSKAKAAAKPASKAAKRAPGNATALQQKAADNLARIAKGKGKAETVATVKTTTDGSHIYVEGSKGSHFTRPVYGDNKAFRAACAIGVTYSSAAEYNRLNPAPKPTARLARGIASGDAPHSAKAVADQKSAKPAAKGKAQAKAPKAAKAKAGADYSYKPTKKANEAKPDSLRHRMLAIIMAHKDTASAKAAAAKAKLAGLNSGWFNWAAANGYITK